MNLDQQLRTDLHDAVELVPRREGSLDDVVIAGARRRAIARFGHLAAVVLIGAVGAGLVALTGPSAPDDAATGSEVSTVGVGGFEVVAGGLVPGFERRQVHRVSLGPASTVATDQYGPEQPLVPAAPPAVGLEAVGAPSIFLGDFPLIPGSGFLYTDTDGLACVWLERRPGETGYEWCIDTGRTRGGAVQWMIEPASSDPADGATVVVAWYGLPPRTSVVTATVDGNPVGWQRVGSGTAILSVPVDLGADLVLTALDATGTMIDFGRDDAGVLIVGEQRFDALTFAGTGQ